MRRIMALDIGLRRVGIAISETGFFARPHSVLHRKSKREDFAHLKQLVERLAIEHVVVGLPYSLSGYESIGPQARKVMYYTEALAEVVDVPYEYFDESYSTVDAEEYRRLNKQTDVPIDAAAATVILQNYLDSQHNQTGYP